MKYTAMINFKAICEHGLDSETDVYDWIILEYIRDWESSQRSVRVGHRVWINLKHMVKSLPMVPVKTKSAATKRLTKLRDLGLIDCDQGPDHRLYVCTTQRYEDVTMITGDF